MTGNLWDGADWDTQNAAYEAALAEERKCDAYYVAGFDVTLECVRLKHQDDPHRSDTGTTWDEIASAGHWREDVVE
jgi:hypothetical protein